MQCGVTLPQIELVYQTYGELNADRSNVILYPTSYGAQHIDIDWLIRPDGILDPTRWFIIIPNMFGNITLYLLPETSLFVTTLSALHRQILSLLKLPESIYHLHLNPRQT
jgi:hypothetical protein